MPNRMDHITPHLKQIGEFSVGILGFVVGWFNVQILTVFCSAAHIVEDISLWLTIVSETFGALAAAASFIYLALKIKDLISNNKSRNHGRRKE